MIQIECDNCERPFEVDDAEAGGKVSCPHCGDVNRVPDAPASQPRVEPAGEPAGAAAAVAVADAKRDLPSGEGAEKEICLVRPAMFRRIPSRAVLIAVLLVGGIVLAIAAPASERVWSWLMWPGLILALLGAGWLLKWWISTTLWIKISITNKRTVRHEGIIRRHSTEVLHDHVRSVDINQNFIQRMLNVGYIGIDSAGQDDIEIEIRDIPGPYEIKKVIDRYRAM